MKKIRLDFSMIKTWMLVATFMLAGISSAQANVVGFGGDGINFDVDNGSRITLDILGEDFLNSTDGGALLLNFNPLVLRVVDVEVPALWNAWSDGGVIDNITGTIRGLEFASFSDPDPLFTIASITFETISDGISWLTLVEYKDGILGGFGRMGAVQNVTFETASVTSVSQVPLPAASWLFLSGIIGLLGRYKSKKA